MGDAGGGVFSDPILYGESRVLFEGEVLVRQALYGTLSDIWESAYFTWSFPQTLTIWASKRDLENGLPPMEGTPLAIEDTFFVTPPKLKNYSKDPARSINIRSIEIRSNFLFGRSLFRLGTVVGSPGAEAFDALRDTLMELVH